MGIKVWAALGLAAASTLAAVVSLVQLSGERQKLAEEREKTQQLAASSQALTSTVTELRAQIQTLLDRVASIQKPEVENRGIAARQASLVTGGAPKRAARPPAARRPADDPRWREMQNRIAENQKEISGTKEQLNQTRDDLESKLNLAREDLGGSIARTNQELTALQRRGERDYFAFELSKSKQFQRVGPVRLSLRKVNVKKRTYDMVLMVDDGEIQKKGVNMLEPVWITLPDRAQPLELVVNQVRKDQVEGYASAAKYKKSELASTGSQPPAEPRPELSRRD